MGTLSNRALDALFGEAIVDAYDAYEQPSSFQVMIEDTLGLPQPLPPPAWVQ